jgi:hypothetical protein
VHRDQYTTTACWRMRRRGFDGNSEIADIRVR